MADAVRTRIPSNARLPKRRTLDECIFIRWPAGYAAIARAVSRLSPRSPLRRALLRRNVLSSFAAVTRQDLELWLLRWSPDGRLELLSELRAAGMRTSYQGHSGLRELMRDWADAWDRIDLVPMEIVDAGNPVVALGHFHLRARGSGIEFESPVAFVWWSERGLVVRQQDFSDWDEALHAAGTSVAS